MGPITLIDKSTIESLGKEVRYLDRYYSLVISPILIRELLSTLAKEPEPNKDWEHRLSVLASKVDTLNSYTSPNAHDIARASLLGDQTPMDGRVPLTGGRKVRARDGTYGVIFEEQEQSKILRDWQQKNFHEYYRKEAAAIRKVDHEVDLAALQKTIAGQMTHFPDFRSLPELAQWMDANFFNGAAPDYHLVNMASGLTTAAELKAILSRWASKRSHLSEFAPYAFYFYRVNTIYFVGLGKGLISASKKAKTHLDIQYVYYLPFSMCFTSSDNHLLEIAGVFKRENQIIIRGEDLRQDLKAIDAYFSTLSNDEEQKHSKEFGIYPPDLPQSVTNRTWAALMQPRPDPSISTPKLSKDQEKALLDRMNRYLHESVTVDDPEPTIATSLRPKRSISERNFAFLMGALERVGITEHQDWEQIKRRFNSDHVKAVYDLHADLWHPNDPFQDLAGELAANDKLRALYLGDIEPYDLVEQIWRWSLHFDQILIPDPFHSPWGMREEYNPLSNPGQFESDTLKLVYDLTLLQPLILSGQLLLVPNPADYNPKLKHLMLSLAAKKQNDPIYKTMTADEEDRVKKSAFQTKTHFIARLPIEKRREAVRAEYPEIDEADVLRYLERIRVGDPLCIDRDSNEGQMTIARSGANFESSILLSGLYGAIPVSAIDTRIREYKRERTPSPRDLVVLTRKLESTPNCRIIDPYFSAVASGWGAVSAFRDCLLQSVRNRRRMPENLDALFEELEEEARFLAEVYAHQSGADGERLLEKTRIELIWSDTHFLTPSATEYTDAYNPSVKDSAPTCFLGLPASKVPSHPFLLE